jgi:uncharacterized protein DUF1670
MVDQEFIRRIKEKNIDTQLLNELRQGYGYPPAIAQSIVDTVRGVLAAPLSTCTNMGVLPYLTTPTTVGAGIKLKDAPMKTVYLTIYSSDDPDTLKEHGTTGLRQSKILRITEEAYEQGAALSIEDLATLLCSSVRTIQYDLKYLRDEGLAVRTRGQVKGIGLRASHKSWIIDLFLNGLEMDELVLRTKHSEQAISNYIENFKRVALMTDRGMPIDEIAFSIGVSKSLVEAYQSLIQEHEGSSRLQSIRSISSSSSDDEKGGSP